MTPLQRALNPYNTAAGSLIIIGLTLGFCTVEVHLYTPVVILKF